MANSVLKNNIKFTQRQGSVFPEIDISLIASDSTWDQGDLLILNASNFIKRGAAEADYSAALGIAAQSVVNGKVVSPYSTDSTSNQALVPLAGPIFGIVATMNLKSGDTFTKGQLVYANPGTLFNEVQAAGAKAVGVYQGPTVTAVASSTGDVLIASRYPGDTFKI